MLYVYRCGKCQRFLKYISAKPQRMYCANCDETYSLPQGGTIKLYKVHRGKKEERSGGKMFQVAFLPLLPLPWEWWWCLYCGFA